MKNGIVQLGDKRFKKYMDNSVIRAAVDNLSKTINNELRGKNPLIIVVLKGAFMFASDLMRLMDFPCEVAFVRLSSYKGTATSGEVIESIGLDENIKERTVLVMEDIVDTGITMHYFINRLKKMGPKEVKLATFFFKPAALKSQVQIDYVAMEIPNDFIVGYGLDYNQMGRNLKDIYVVTNE